MTRHLAHITLTTGHSRRSWRREVGDDTIALLQPLLADVLAGRQVAVPGDVGDYTLSASGAGRCLIATVWGPPVAEAGGARPPVVTLGVAGHSRCGATLWRLLHDSPRPPAVMPEMAITRCPPEPWCAVRIEVGAALCPDAMAWLGDFERCLAWAWLERPGATVGNDTPAVGNGRPEEE